MPYFNKPFFGQDENPLVKTPYFETWQDDVPTPPPGSKLLITQAGDYLITQLGDFLETQAV